MEKEIQQLEEMSGHFDHLLQEGVSISKDDRGRIFILLADIENIVDQMEGM